MKIYTKQIICSGKPAVVACDGQCSKAWGVIARPKASLGGGDDDIAYFADGELGDAPARSGTWEAGFNKPSDPTGMNRWCTRQCERSVVVDPDAEIALPDFSVRRYNQPWLHLDDLRACGHPQLESAIWTALALACSEESEGPEVQAEPATDMRESLIGLRNLARKTLQEDPRDRRGALEKIADGLSALTNEVAPEGEALFAHHARIDAMSRLSMVASTAMIQNIVDQTNLLEDIADAIDKIVLALPPGSPVAPVFIGYKPSYPNTNRGHSAA